MLSAARAFLWLFKKKQQPNSTSNVTLGMGHAKFPYQLVLSSFLCLMYPKLDSNT